MKAVLYCTVFIEIHIIDNHTTVLIMGRHGRHRMVAVFTTIYKISAYHHKHLEFESRSGEVYSLEHCVIKYDSDLWQVGGFLRLLRFPPQIQQSATI